ncbi:MAG: hypothetical protein AAFX09_08105 [Pseudomonadota bacterium]
MSKTGEVLGQGALSADRLRAANIHPETGLATDYLNHFNEVVMLLEMLADVPDCAEDVLDWSPASYSEHFERSGFADKELAVQAYEAAPKALRAHFETVIEALNEELIAAQQTLRAGDAAAASERANGDIKLLLAAAGAAIHGRIEGEELDDATAAQAGVDALFG